MNKLFEEERLFRKIPNNPIMIKEDGTISSAVFKDSQGCSVDRQGERNKQEIYNNFIMRFGTVENAIRAVADVSVQNCYDKNAIVKELPETDNPYHCEIHGSNEKISLSQGQAKYLAKEANVHFITDLKSDT